MAKKLDPAIAEVLKAYGFGPEAAWDCHGTWVVYHRVLEQIAAKAKIKFDPPQVLEANGPAKSVAICVKGKLYGPEIGNTMAEEWSIGEAAPGNNKNAYPYAMAEKRAKDRVILKLIGLHGLAYSEDEADDFKASAPAPEAPKQPKAAVQPARNDGHKLVADALILAARQARSIPDLKAWWMDEKTQAALKGLPESELVRVREAKAEHHIELEDGVPA